MRDILIIIEDLGDGAAELAAAARSLGEVATTAVLRGGTEADHQRLASLFDKVIHLPAADDHADSWDAEFLAANLLPLIEQSQPFLVLLLHGNNALDLAPLLAARLDRPMLADCLSLEPRDDGLGAVRTVYGGKVHARVLAREAAGGYLATIRPGAFTAAEAAGSGSIEAAAPLTGFEPRRRFLETVRPEAGAVDITQADILVSVGRGIEDEDNIEIVEALADALDGELACTRPVVDKQWLDKSRQVGTSGLTVKPKVYLAVGVSGSFQHLGGVKGGPFMIAINQDPAAPIFAAADVGVVGDLFDLVPLLEEKIRERKG
jgi:electron transfer flavoprotein alpha subunit